MWLLEKSQSLVEERRCFYTQLAVSGRKGFLFVNVLVYLRMEGLVCCWKVLLENETFFVEARFFGGSIELLTYERDCFSTFYFRVQHLCVNKKFLFALQKRLSCVMFLMSHSVFFKIQTIELQFMTSLEYFLN